MFTIEVKRLRSLRRKQYIITNIFNIIMVTIFFVLLLNEISLNKIMICLGVFIFLTPMFERWFDRLIYILFPYLKELSIYEEEKLGEEWDKMKTSNNVTNFIVGTLLILDGIKNHSVIRPEELSLRVMILVYFIFIILINSSLFFHNRKIDKGNINSLKGYTRKQILFGFKIGLIFIISLLTIVFIILHREY